MLTLTRKVGESIRIGDDIQIVVKEIRKNQVRIGIVAPRDVKIFREEVYQNIVQENRASAQADASVVEGLAGKLGEKKRTPVKVKAPKDPSENPPNGSESNDDRGDD